MTLQTVWNGYKSQLRQLASSKNDISWMAGLYYQYMDAVNWLRAEIGMPPIQEEPSKAQREESVKVAKDKFNKLGWVSLSDILSKLN
jgi:hypothetical protein